MNDNLGAMSVVLCDAGTASEQARPTGSLSLAFLYQFRLLKNCHVLAMGVSFQGHNHCSGDRGTAPKFCVIIVAATQRKVAGSTWLLCACPGALNCWHGGGKKCKSHSGCGLEKRPPWPR